MKTSDEIGRKKFRYIENLLKLYFPARTKKQNIDILAVSERLKCKYQTVYSQLRRGGRMHSYFFDQLLTIVKHD